MRMLAWLVGRGGKGGVAEMRDQTMPVRVIEGQASLRSQALTSVLRLMTRRPLRPDSDLMALRRRYEAWDARHFPVDATIVQREPVDCAGVPASWVRVPESRPGRVLLYFHGGSFAFRLPHVQAAFAARLCRRLGASALIPDYRLIPEFRFPAAPDDCQVAYRWLLDQGCNHAGIVMMGDSAGATLALVTLHRSTRAGQPLPACAVLLSPAVDCTLDSPSIVENQGRDPMFRLSDLLVLRRHYVPSPHLYTHPEVSPLFADFAGFPPLLMQTGSSEMLRDEAVRAARKAHAAGVDVELELWPGTPHVFQIASFLPESTLAVENITDFVCTRTGWKPTSTASDQSASRQSNRSRRRNGAAHNTVHIAMGEGGRW
jgi:acetyl esterase/lipase